MKALNKTQAKAVVSPQYVASWEIFDECLTCGTAPKGPCYNLKTSTSRNLVINAIPHRGRKRIKNVK